MARRAPTAGLRRFGPEVLVKISLYASKPAPFGRAYEILFEAGLTGSAAAAV